MMHAFGRTVRGRLAVLALAGFLIYPALYRAAKLFGWEYVLRDRTAWATVVALLALPAAAFDRPETRLSRAAALLALPACCLCGLMLEVGIVDARANIPLAVAVALAIALFARAPTPKPVKIPLGVASGIALALLVPLVLIATFFPPAVTEMSFPSPDGDLVAELRLTDEGALGGSTRLTVCDRGVPLLLGMLRPAPRELFRDGWMPAESARVEWIDDAHVAFDGMVYAVDE